MGGTRCDGRAVAPPLAFQQVSDHRHHYAYSVAGDSVSWHLPEILERGTSRLSDFMSIRTRQFLLSDDDLPSREQGLDVAGQFLRSADRISETILVDNT